VWLRLIIGIFWRQLPDAMPHKHAALLNAYSCFNNQPHAMTSNAGVTILDEVLACIGGRIAAILIQPADKNKNNIASLHNEVVCILWC
jgi:hypothetical protein